MDLNDNKIELFKGIFVFNLNIGWPSCWIHGQPEQLIYGNDLVGYCTGKWKI